MITNTSEIISCFLYIKLSYCFLKSETQGLEESILPSALTCSGGQDISLEQHSELNSRIRLT